MPEEEYCGTYCEHNAHKKCECQPCVWIRENTGFLHGPGCRYDDGVDSAPKGLQ